VIVLSTVLLSYNRLNLLKKTIDSYLSTISVPFELIIVDNLSSEDVRNYLKIISSEDSRIKNIFLDENLGGKGFNIGLEMASGQFLHTSENDLEYLPGWDKELLEKFEVFPELGQLSLFSHIPQKDIGEILRQREYEKKITRDGKTIFKVKFNVSTPSIFRRKVFEKGVRWKTRTIIHDKFRFPADYKFSQAVIKLGYWVAWNDKYTVKNLGFNIKEWMENTDYYVENFKAKKDGGLPLMKNLLNENGYDLVLTDGKYQIKKI